MSAISVEAHRRRFNVRATPMQPLSAVVEDVLLQLKLEGVRPQDCQLKLKGKALDLATPVRFANIGRDKLELVTGREPVLGVQTAPAAAPAAAPPSALAATPAPAAAAQPVQPPPVQQQQQQQQAAAPASAPSPVAPAASTGAPPAPPAAAPSASTAAPAPPADTHLSVALFGRRVYVFTRQAEQETDGGASAGPAEEDESFFEFTEVDLRCAMASAATQRAKQEGGPLMTAAMREREERRRAESYGSVPIRLYLPDGVHCLQTALPATEPLSAVLALARAALQPGAAAAAYLFTTPPRTVVKEKDLGLSLYAAKLVPAAKVHVGLQDASKAGASGPTADTTQLIRPATLALVERPPQRGEVMHAGRPEQQVGGTSGADASGSGASGSGASGSGAAARTGATGGKGVPKWMKLGK